MKHDLHSNRWDCVIFVIWNNELMYKIKHLLKFEIEHYNDVIMGPMASQIPSLTIVYSTGYSDANQRKHQSSASLAFVKRIHWWPVIFPHKWPVTRKIFPSNDVIMQIPHASQDCKFRQKDRISRNSNHLESNPRCASLSRCHGHASIHQYSQYKGKAVSRPSYLKQTLHALCM